MRLNTIIGILLLSCVYCISCSSTSNEERVPCSFVCNTNDILYSGGNTPYRLSRSPLDCIPEFQSFHSDTITSENIGKNYTAVWSLIYDSLQLCMLEHTDSIKYGENRECPAELYTDLQKFLNRPFVNRRTNPILISRNPIIQSDDGNMGNRGFLHTRALLL